MALAAICSTSIAQAGTQLATWMNGNDGVWSDATNWSTDPLVPKNGNGGQDYSVEVFSGDVLVDLPVEIEQYIQSFGRVTLSGFGNDLIVNTDSVLADEEGVVSMFVENGGRVYINASFNIGRFADAEVNVRNGGVLETVDALLGNARVTGPFSLDVGDGIVTIDGAGSEWRSHETIVLGDGGHGLIKVVAGGSLTSRRIDVGESVPTTTDPVRGDGRVLVTGNDSLLTVDIAVVGLNGGGNLTVEDGGVVDVLDTISIYSRGSVTLAEGTINALDESPFRGINIAGGGLEGSGVVKGRVRSEGWISPGKSSPGILTFDGTVQLQDSSELRFELGGMEEGVSYDHFDVSGDLMVDGDLVVRFLDGFQSLVASDDTFTLARVTGDTSSLTGSFDKAANNARLDTKDGRGSFLVHYGLDSAFDPKQIILSDFQPADPGVLVGDYNQDGVVNAADYVVWRNHDGTFFDLPNRNPELSGAIGVADYDSWVTSFGSTLNGGHGLGTELIPEPSSVLLTLMSVLVLVTSIGTRRTCIRLTRQDAYPF